MPSEVELEGQESWKKHADEVRAKAEKAKATCERLGEKTMEVSKFLEESVHVEVKYDVVRVFME